MKYNWQLDGWPNLFVDEDAIGGVLAEFSSSFSALAAAIGGAADADAEVESLSREAVRSSAVEGVVVDESVVTSSICRALGVKCASGGFALDRRAEGIAALVLDVKRDWNLPLSTAMLRRWHLDLMRGDVGGMAVGEWRGHSDAMQIVRRNAYGDVEVRFVAPPSDRVADEMARFSDVLSGYRSIAVRASVAHLLFESIHPFEDGNGRIGRAIVQKLLAEELGSPTVLPISVRIDRERRKYYEILNAASFGLDATAWTEYFVRLVSGVCDDFAAGVDFVRMKKAYLAHFEGMLNPRQAKALKVCLRDGLDGVGRGLSVAKYMRITGVSKATATRDLGRLHSIGAVSRIGNARATSYVLDVGGRWPE